MESQITIIEQMEERGAVSAEVWQDVYDSNRDEVDATHEQLF